VHPPARLGFVGFGADGDPLVSPNDASYRQSRYLRCYLQDLGAQSLVIEPNYFDRDYLSEFAAFYATSSAGHLNICRRIHYFCVNVTPELFESALGGNTKTCDDIQAAYLGYVVIRPIEGAPIGRTVLRAYSDEQGIRERTPRVLEAARRYQVHIAGLTLIVEGLAWQQQDSAVGSCATVALWSMLHSSAFDDHHAIPTTAAITALGHWTTPTGQRTFPDSGLQVQQVLAVINEQGLAPLLLKGELENEEFSRRRFCTLLASFLRSGYPVLVSGFLDYEGAEERELHSICVVGFRSSAPQRVENGELQLDDQNLQHIYIHDDNLGPNVRFLVGDGGAVLSISLIPQSPEPRNGPWPCLNPAASYYELVPSEMIVAVHQELRTDPIALQEAAIGYAQWLPAALQHETEQQGGVFEMGMLIGSRFIRLHEYAEDELRVVLQNKDASVLARARLALWQDTPPMSLHVGLVRVSLGTEPMVDILFDTSDSDRHLKPTAYVAFHPKVASLLERWTEEVESIDLGVLVQAW
jgi:hypothetical protein